VIDNIILKVYILTFLNKPYFFRWFRISIIAILSTDPRLV